MNNYNQRNTENYQMPSYDQAMPPLPTGIPTGPENSPIPTSPDVQAPMGTLPAPLPQPMPGMQPQQAGECPFQMDMPYNMAPMNMPYNKAPMNMPNPMRPMNMKQPGTVAPLPGSFPSGEQSPLTTMNPLFTPGFLRTQIGRTVRVEFLIGTNSLTDRVGTLVGVGTSYILLREIQSPNVILCDIYSIKFVTFYY
jgi:hypothetical protein